MGHPAQKFIKTTIGPMGVVKSCTICGFHHYRPKGYGRGSGMREGNISRGVVLRHINAEHPDHLTKET